MHIVALEAENVKRIRAVEIRPKGRIVQVTGKNSAGKTSVIDSIYYALAGKKSLPEKPVRRGAEKARIKLNLGELIVTRTIGANGTNTLAVESAKGARFSSPQQVLDELLGELAFDPLEFIRMKPKEQVDALRNSVKLEIDMDQLTAENETDFARRRELNRDVERLQSEVNAIAVQPGLPKERVDEAGVLKALNEAGEQNIKATMQNEHRAAVQSRLVGAKRDRMESEKAIETRRDAIARLEEAIALERKALADREEDLKEDQAIEAEIAAELEGTKAGEFVNVASLTAQLQELQLTNREIEKRERRAELENRLQTAQRESSQLTRAMADRDEKKRNAVSSAVMPVPGLQFDEDMNGVLFNRIPLDQLGEAEQIRISASIAMAANPKLRIMRILHGEAMDEDSLAILAEMAEANDFQIWIARVDSSGKIGIFMEDGAVKEVND